MSVHGKHWALVIIAGVAAGVGPLSCEEQLPKSRDEGATTAFSGLDARPHTTTCKPFAESSALRIERYLPDLTFEAPVGMVQGTANGPLYVYEQHGRIWRVDPRTQKSTLFGDFRDRVITSYYEWGFLGFAASPQFESDHEAYVSYTKASDTSLFRLVISRVKSLDGGLTLDLSTEREILSIPHETNEHTGGRIAFGPDGYLYLGSGDGEFGGPDKHAQNTGLLLGKFLRIDPVGQATYAIPPDNPYANGGGRPEIFALGLRNPWGWSFDSLSSQLYAGDVGHDRWEEVDVVERGANYGWPYLEGPDCFNGNPCDPAAFKKPYFAYPHPDGDVITGGFVYRGTKIPSLYGKYIFADYLSGAVFTTADQERSLRLLVRTGFYVSSFAETIADRELYVLDHRGGGVYHLLENTEPAQVPNKLGDTGCIDRTDPKKIVEGLIPYDVAAPFYSGGATKERFFQIPDGTTIKVAAGFWQLPPESMVMKHFSLAGKRIETRLLVNHEGAWAGYTYEWDDSQADAMLVVGGKGKQIGDVAWKYPSESQCFFCHNAITGRTIGFAMAQLNRPIQYPTLLVANQIDTASYIGLFTEAIDSSTQPKMVDPYGAAQLGVRARTWLHANCAYCHQQGGPGLGAPNFLYSRALSEMNTCNVNATRDNFGVPGAKLISPGSPETSVVSKRIRDPGARHMPPLGQQEVDPRGADLVDAWIRSLKDCQ